MRVFPEANIDCTSVGLENASSFSSDLEVKWERSAGLERELELPEVDSEKITLVAFTSDAQENVIQFACIEVTLELIGDLDVGVLELRLSRRPGVNP